MPPKYFLKVQNLALWRIEINGIFFKIDSMNEPNIFEYLDIRHFLKALYKYKKFKEKSFSYSQWADELSIKSRGNLRDIITGKASLGENLIPQFLKMLQCDNDKAEYFVLLTRYSYAPTEEIKEIYGKKLLPMWKRKLHEVEIKDIEGFLSSSITPILFTYLTFDDTSTSISEIAENLHCDEIDIRNSLRFLTWNKLIDGEVLPNGEIRYKTTQPFFNVPTTLNNSFIRDYHINTLKLAQQAHNYEKSSRRFQSYLIALTPEEFSFAVKTIKECNDQLLGLFNSSQLGHKKIYMLNYQVFPVHKVETQNEDTPLKLSES